MIKVYKIIQRVEDDTETTVSIFMPPNLAIIERPFRIIINTNYYVTNKIKHAVNSHHTIAFKNSKMLLDYIPSIK